MNPPRVLRRWGSHVRRHPILGVLEITLLWHAVLIAVAEGLPPLAPGWFPDLGAAVVNLVCATRLMVLVFLVAYGFSLTRGRSRRSA